MRKISNNALRSLSRTVNTVYDMRAFQPQEAEVGIEIECEGESLHFDMDEYWDIHEDGSLRGESAEYVLSGPIHRTEVVPALRYLDDKFLDNGSEFSDTYRTSVHVHLNVQHRTMTQVVNQICLYTIFEDLLVEFCGKDRIGNLFCLRISDAENVIDAIRRAITRNDWYALTHDTHRYSAINVTALGKYGSLEFRSFRGTTDIELINTWVNILLDIYDSAKMYANPQEICSELSILGPKAFIEKTFSAENAALLVDFPNYGARLMRGVRLAQDIAYCTDEWNQPAPEYVPEFAIIENVPAPEFNMRDQLGRLHVLMDRPYFENCVMEDDEEFA